MAGAPYITDKEFESKVLQSEVPVVLDFTAAWCGPCKAIAPLLDQVANQHEGALKVYKLDIDENAETPNQFGVQTIPTLLLFKGGKLINRNVGSINKVGIEKFVKPAFD